MSTPQFFVPDPAKSDKQEEAYAEFARMAGRVIPERRIHSITFVHDGEEWTATVGEQLRGIKHRMTRSKGQRLERTTAKNIQNGRIHLWLVVR